MRTRAPIALAVVATVFLAASAAAQIPGLNRARDAIGGAVRLPSLSSFLEGDPPITTNLDDARTETAFLDDWSPRGWERLDRLPRTDQGAFRLRPGRFALEAQSYCMHAGTHGPGGGDGYLYAPLAGSKAPIVQSILRNSVAHPEIPQRNIQVLIWAIIARTEFDEMPRETQQTARALLSRDEIGDLSKGALGLVPESVMREAMSRLPPVARQVFQAEAELRSRLSSGVSSFEELERIAVLAGNPLADPDSRPVPEERWSFDPGGYFVRYDPSGYSHTRVEVSVPRPVAIAHDASGRIVGIHGQYGRRLEMGGGGLRLVGPRGGAGQTVLGAIPSPAGGSPAAAVLSAVLGSRAAPADALRDLAEIERLARAVRASGTAVGDGVSAPGGAVAVPSARAGALDLLVEAWQATFCLAAGCPTTPAGDDVLVLRSGATVRGALTWCGGDVCTLGTSHFPLDEIEWIGLAPEGAGPPAPRNPGAGEVHLGDGSVRAGDLFSLGERLVLTDTGGHRRPDVAWIHVVPGEEEEEEEPSPPFAGGAPDGGAPDGGVTPPSGGEQGGGGGFDGPVFDPSDDVATPGNRARQRLAQSGRNLPEEDDCADEREEYERLKAERIAAYQALNEAFDRFTEIPGHGDYNDEGYTGPGADLAGEVRRLKQEAEELAQREQAAHARLLACEGGGSGEDDCADERLEYELLKDQRIAAWQAINEAFDRFTEIPGHGDYNDENYTGPGADLAQQIRQMKQEAEDLSERERAAYERLLACEGGGSGDREEDDCAGQRQEYELLKAQRIAAWQAINEVFDRFVEIPGHGDYNDENYTGPGADLAEQIRQMKQEAEELARREREAEERLRECEGAVG